MHSVLSKAAVTAIYLALFAWIVAILPTACDAEYEHEHPTDVYISPADQVLIDIKNKDKDYE